MSAIYRNTNHNGDIQKIELLGNPQNHQYKGFTHKYLNPNHKTKNAAHNGHNQIIIHTHMDSDSLADFLINGCGIDKESIKLPFASYTDPENGNYIHLISLDSNGKSAFQANEIFIKQIELFSECSFSEMPQPDWYQKINLMQIRGFLGIIGQALFLMGGKYNNDALEQIAGVMGLVSNGMTTYYGSQKHTNQQLQQNIESAITDIFDSHDINNIISPDRIEQIIAQQRSFLQTFDKTLESNSLKASDSIKLATKLVLTASSLDENARSGNPIDLVNNFLQALFAGKSDNIKNWNNAASGIASILAKIITLAGKEKDDDIDAQKLNKNQNILLQWVNFARESVNQISGGLELFSVLAVGYKDFNALMENLQAQPGAAENNVNYFKLAASAFLTIAMLVKISAPFSVARIDNEKLEQFVAKNIAQIPEPERSELLLEVSVDIARQQSAQNKQNDNQSLEFPNIAEIYDSLSNAVHEISNHNKIAVTM